MPTEKPGFKLCKLLWKDPHAKIKHLQLLLSKNQSLACCEMTAQDEWKYATQ